jgi:hypothetical protein
MTAGTLAVGTGVASPALSVAAGKRPTPRHRCSFSIESIGNNAPTAVSGPFDPATTGTFAVLRRASLPEDTPPPINPFAEDLSYRLRTYFPGEIRQLEQDAEGNRYFLLPGFERGFPVVPARCLPERLRKRQAKFIAEQRRREIEPAYCIEVIGPHRPRYAGGSCQPFSTIQTGERLIATAASRSDVIELAPDGVATVRIRYPAGEVIDAPVSSNSYSFTPPPRLIKEALAAIRHLVAKGTMHLSERQREALGRLLVKRAEHLSARLIPQTVQWLDAAGNTLRSFTPSSRIRGLALLGLLISGEGESSNVAGGFPISTG